MKDKEWQEKYGHDWQVASRKDNKDMELGVDWEYGPNGEHLEYKTITEILNENEEKK